MGNITEKLNTSIELINRWKTLQEKIKDLQQYVNYLNQPPMTYRHHKKQNKDTAATVIDVIGGIAMLLFLILSFIEMGRVNDTGYQIKRHYAGQPDSGTLIFLYLLLALISCIVGICVPNGIRKNKYRQFLQKDNQHRAFCQSKVPEYNKTVEEINSLETYMSNPQICIIPKDYWNYSLEISGYIRNGVVKTVDEAIRLLPKPATNSTVIVCPKCGTQNSANGKFCGKCGQKLM